MSDTTMVSCGLLASGSSTRILMTCFAIRQLESCWSYTLKIVRGNKTKAGIFVQFCVPTKEL